MPGKVARLQKILPERAAGLIASPVNRRYCTGFASSEGMLLFCRDEAVFFTDSRYIEAARGEITALPVEEKTDGKKQLGEFCKRHGVKRLLIEDDRTTLEEYARLRRLLPGIYIERGRLLSNALTRLRKIKSREEAAHIQAAQGIAEAALAHILEQHFKEGVTEKELALELEFYMLRHGAEAIAFETIVVAGENGSRPHGVPGSRALRQGDLVTMDFGCVVHGLHSDMTRTVACGGCGEEAREVYEVVLRAQEAALAAVKPGVKCAEIDRIARDIIRAAGYDEHFRHGTGHGVGFEIHEGPSLSPKSKDILEPGMVVTVEPGIYIPGKCGVRIEDMALITQDGCENLTGAGKRL